MISRKIKNYIPTQTKMFKKFSIYIIFAVVLFLFSDCRKVSYSLTGINIGDAKTILISNLFNNSGQGPSNLSQVFTESLKDYYQKNSPLKIVAGESDLILEGAITSYTYTPMALGADQAQQNRLTITLQITFINTKNDEQNLKNTTFSFYRDFDATRSLSDIEASSDSNLKPIIDQIIFDIFNKTVANW